MNEEIAQITPAGTANQKHPFEEPWTKALRIGIEHERTQGYRSSAK